MKTAIILYEYEQLVSLDAMCSSCRKEDDPPLLVSLDAEIDYALGKRGRSFISGKTLQDRSAPSAFLRADEITSAVFNTETVQSFRYRDVPVFEALRFPVHIYLIDLLYYIGVIQRLLETEEGITHIVVPTSTAPVPKTSGSLAPYHASIILDATRLAVEKRAISFESFESQSAPLRFKNTWYVQTLALKRVGFGVLLSFSNMIMGLRVRRPIRLLVSDYWRNIAPIMQELPEAEIILIDRTQALKAGLKNLWRHKMRLLHTDHFLSWHAKRRAHAYAQECGKKWERLPAAKLASSDLVFDSIHLGAFIHSIMTTLVKTAVPGILHDIEGTYALYERLAPDVVILRVSVSTQRHFTLLPLVARLRGIPALELQHGIEYLGKGSATRRHAAEYLALYGSLVKNEHLCLGDAEERLLPVGSPRFDSYIEKATQAPKRESHDSIAILSNTPTMSVGERHGTYSIEHYFTALRDAVKAVPSARLTVTTRSTEFRSAFSVEARERGLAGVPYEDAGSTPLPRLFEKADIFVCSYSTVVYEALLYRLPVVLAAFAPVDGMMSDFHFSRFVKEGALIIAHSPEELSAALQKLSADPEERARMSAAGWEFMQKNFSFDGHARTRIAALIKGWTGKIIS